ncbi:MAG: hypothetical protein GY869_10670 [Planctomycetes bacterium]|nr:hypothetical protein [Planctomycetota bacterium]
MSIISGVNNSLIQSQLATLQLRQNVDVGVAKKTLDHARMQGDAALALLDSAVQVAQGAEVIAKPRLTIGALVSGLGQNLDCSV